MPAPAGTASPHGAPYGFLVLAITVHVFDVLLRYGTTPVPIGNNPGSEWLWILFFFLYALLWLDARALPAFKDNMTPGGLLFVALMAYLWGPFWSIIPGYFPAIKYVAALFMMIAPFWLLAAFYATQEFPKASLIYSLIWLFLITFALFPNIKQYADEQGHPLPDSLNPGAVVSYSWEKGKEGWNNFYQLMFVKAPKKIGEDIQRQIAIASGDYYTGKVDAAAQKRLGVYIENFHPTEQAYYVNTPVTTTVTMKAETLDTELGISVACDADGTIAANKILPKSAFTVLTFDQYDIDCIWNKGALGKGSHTLNFRSEFDFTTRAYLKAYLMDQDRLREYRRQNADPLKDLQDKNPVAIYTSGPVRIGMSLGKQPLAVSKSGEALQSWGVTIENAWEGKVIGITGAFFSVPKGLAVNDPESLGMTLTTCAAVPQEEQPTCDDTLVNVYTLTPGELQSPLYKNLTIKSFRIPLTITDPARVLGKSPLAIQNFKTSIQYRYLLERSTSTTVREEPK